MPAPVTLIRMNNSNKRNKGQKIKIICAWCGKDMGEKDGEGIEGVSHGMCNECAVAVQTISRMEDRPRG